MRYFLGLELPLALRMELAAMAPAVLAAARAAPAVGGPEPPAAPRFLPAEDLHLTLRFLGEPDSATGPGAPSPEDLAAAVVRAAVGHGPVPIFVRGVGSFPADERERREPPGGRPPRPPRVVFAGVRADPGLELLQRAAEEAAVDLGFPPEPRPYRPHVTLWRPRRGEAAWALTVLPALSAASPAATFEADQLVLFSNRGALEGRPPRYRVEATAPLTGRP